MRERPPRRAPRRLVGYDLALEVDASVLEEHLVLCTTYSRASLPVACGVGVDPKALIPCTEDGFWAVRVVRRDGRDTRPVPVRAKLIHSRNPLPHLLHEIS